MSKYEGIKSVAVIGAGAAGIITAVALKAENHFERIQVFERRSTAGGTWIYDPDPSPELPIYPGQLPPETDPRLDIPADLPQVKPHNTQERYALTPIYDSLTTNVPDIAMAFSDARFAYGPFAPHYVPRQYLENYATQHKVDEHLVLNTTVEDVTRLPPEKGREGLDRWRLVLRRHDLARHVDVWWEEIFDAVVVANGHYSVPIVPQVKGLDAYLEKFPGRVVHSKYYRSPAVYADKRVVVIGNSASGHDVTADLVPAARLPVYQSRRTPSRWDGDKPPPGIAWKPIISEFDVATGRIVFADGTHLDDVDAVIYCTGYRPSYPFWHAAANGRDGNGVGGAGLWDYEADKLVGNYWHTFFRDLPTLAAVGVPRTLTFRSFEYQAVAIARLWAGRSVVGLPDAAEQARWEADRERLVRREHRRFHDIPWEDGETRGWLQGLFDIAGLGTLTGEGRVPPVLTRETIWAIEHLRKYPEPGKGGSGKGNDRDHGEKVAASAAASDSNGEPETIARIMRSTPHQPGEESEETPEQEAGWILVNRPHKQDLLGFI